TLLVGCFFIALLGALAVPSLRAYLLPVGIICIGLFFQSISQLCLSVYQAHGRIWPATVGDSIGRILQVVGLGACALAFTQTQFASRSVVIASIVFMIGASAALWWHVWL